MHNTLYKVLKPNGEATHAAFSWPLPNGETPGDWVTVDGPLKLCSNALHLTGQPARWYEEGYRVFAVEVPEEAGRTDYDAIEHKIGVSKCRLLRELTDCELCNLLIVRKGFSRDIVAEGDYVVVEGGTIEAVWGGTIKAEITGYYSTVIWYSGTVTDNIRDHAVVIDRRNPTAPLAIIGEQKQEAAA